MGGDERPTMPKWQAAPGELVQAFGEMVKALPGVETRKVFGYPCAFFRGQMFAGLHQANMILRLSEGDRARFLAIEGATLFEPMPGRPMREYVVVPPAILNQPSAMTDWLDRALAYAASLPAKPAKKAQRSLK